MNYSRQQLYALGEPIGEYATRKVAGRVVYGFGGGGGGPTSSTVTQTNIPDWLRPQVETVLGGAMQELFQTQPGEGGKLNITGVKPFTPYSEDPSAYVAGFSPMQKQAFGATANLQVPGQFMEGTGMAQQAGLGGFGAAQQAAGLAEMQAGAGGQYMQMATNPFATQAFMSPYMQNVVDVQQQQAQRQADIANQAMRAKIAQSGGFGGRGAFLAPAQANADLMRQKQDIQAKGLQSAFDQARQAQQFGADLNLRGLSGAQQGMSNVLGGFDLLGRQGTNVANIGAQQLGAQKDIIGLQAQMGGVERQREQDIINQAVQTFAQKQENPMQRYNAYNALLRGYAAPGYTATQYQAAPPMASQVAGLTMGAYGLSKMAKGGSVKSSRPKGIAAFATGGIPEINRKVLFDPDSVSLEQVQQGVKNETLSDLIGVPVALQKQKMSQSPNISVPTNQPTLTDQAMQPSGIAALPSNLTMNMAKGGIIAFSDRGLVDTDSDSDDGQEEAPKSRQQQLTEMFPDLAEGSINDPKFRAYLLQRTPELFRQMYGFKYDDMTPEETTKQYNAAMARAKAAAGPSPIDALRAQLGDLYGNRDTEKEKGAAFLQAGAALMQPGMSFAQGLGQAGSVLGQKYAQIAKDDTAAKRARAQMEFNLADAERKERMGLHRDATASVAQAAKNRRDARTAEFNRLKGMADLSTRTLTATRPPGTGGSGRQAQVRLPEQLAAAEIAYANAPTPENQRRVEALRSAVAQTRTSDIGPGREGVGLSGPSVTRESKIQEDYRNVMMGITFHPLMPDYREARTALNNTKPGTKAREEASAAVLRIQKQIRDSIEAEYPTIAPARAPAAAPARAPAAAPARAPAAAGPAPLPNLTPGMSALNQPGGVSVSGWSN